MEEPIHVNEAVNSDPSPRSDQSPLPWERIEDNRFKPRRIKGSFPGRELG